MAESAGTSKGSLAGSKRKMEFEFKKEFFETIAPSLTCSFCEIVPKEGPLYNAKCGRIACQDCKNEKLPDGVAMTCTENMLKALPLAACRYRKNDCKIVQDPKNIAYHEEDCQFRNVECYYPTCGVTVAFSKLDDHFQAYNHHTGRLVDAKGSKLRYGAIFQDSFFDAKGDTAWGPIPIKFNEKKFILHLMLKLKEKYYFAWLQMQGSKYEAKNFKYFIQLQEKEDLGTPTYKGPMKSLDDKRTDVLESKLGLVVPLDVLKKHMDEQKILHLEIEIEDLKPKDDENDRDSDVSNEDD